MVRRGGLEVRVELAPGIVVDPEVRFGRPIIEGTRVPVELVIGKLAGGMTTEEVADEYGLSVAEVRAALAYAAKVLADEEVRGVA
jgi:uncharacterized protein (DUF433 family)